VADAADNCELTSNPNQLDTDNDQDGNACDADDDGDTVADAGDNCPLVVNANQSNLDNDALGDACDPDIDGDNVANGLDNCPNVANANQANGDADEFGDACDPDNVDTDGDGLLDGVEIACGLDPNVNDVAGDLDHDGVANGAECTGGTNVLPVLFLTTFNTGNANTYGVVVNLRQPNAALRPQAAEVLIDYDATKLHFNVASSVRGASAQGAQKDFLAADFDADTLRFTLIGVNNRVMNTGEIARLVFDRVAPGNANLTFDIDGQDATELGPAAALGAQTFGVGHPSDALVVTVQ
jgi:hypothetical protein